MMNSIRRARCLLPILAGMALLSAAPAFAANNCLQDTYNLTNKQTLNCTANDVRVAKVINTRNLDGSARATCTGGSTFSFIADFLVQTTSSSSRSNVGLYFANKDVSEQPDALTGSCSDNIVSPQVNPDTTTHLCASSTVTCGSTHYDELDPQVDKKGNPAPDNCGDSTSNDPTVCLGPPDSLGNASVVACGPNNTAPPGGSVWPGTQVVTVEIPGFSCPNVAAGTQLELPNCTSWQIPGGTIQCYSPPPSWPFETAAIPGSPSKCNCGTVPLPIIVQTPSASVTKRCTTANTSGLHTSCTLSPEGGDVTYTVAVTNTSNTGNITVKQLCDSAYGTVFRDSSLSSSVAACAAGSETGVSINSTTCDSTTLGGINGTAKSCTFTVTQAENKVVSDTVSIYGTGDLAGSFGPVSSNSVQVTSGEAPSSATVTKGLDSIQAACETARFTVDVQNTQGYDEDINLTGLNDSYFGSITTVHSSGDGAVLGTTCGVTTGIGTFAGVCDFGTGKCTSGNVGASCSTNSQCSIAGGGTFPAFLAHGTTGANPPDGAHYLCEFDAEFCHAIRQIVTTPGTCTNGTCTAGLAGSCQTNSDCDVTCAGIQNSDKVTGTYTNGETGETSNFNFTETANSLIVSQCLPAPVTRSTIP